MDLEVGSQGYHKGTGQRSRLSESRTAAERGGRVRVYRSCGRMPYFGTI
jgi:hypothetical protein